jgi:hypothetical protein
VTTLRPAGHTASELEVEYDGRWPEYDSDAVTAVWAAWDGAALRVDPGTAELVACGLCELSNAADERSRDLGVSPDERKHARHAATGLATLMVRARAVTVTR